MRVQNVKNDKIRSSVCGYLFHVMASKATVRPSLQSLHIALDSHQTTDAKSHRSLPLQLLKISESELDASKISPESGKTAIPTLQNENALNPNHEVSVDSSAEISPVSRILSPGLCEARNCLEASFNQEKKISGHESVKTSSVSAKLSDGASSLAKTSGSAKISDRADFVDSGKSSMCRGSTSSDVSDESSCSSFSSSISKPHKANDSRWEAIQAVRAKDGMLGLSHFRLLKRLGCGDIGSVYLAELSATKCYFAMKVMDKASLASRKKLLRAQTEREILQSLDHPFLPTLYTHFETDKFSCLVMEFCPGGDLHTLRQRQPGKYFSEQAVKYDFMLFLCANEPKVLSFSFTWIA